MQEEELLSIISQVQPLDEAALQRAKERQSRLAKPPGSLGKLEEISIRLAGITGKVCNQLTKKRIIVFCADNGVTEEGVSSAPVSVTLAQAGNMTRHLTGMSSMALAFGDEVQVVDMGIAGDYDNPQILRRSLGKGTRNFTKGPAMDRETAITAIMTGIELVRQAKSEGVDIIGTGEMGIGNTSTSSAVLCALTGLSIEEVTGRGGGLTDEAFEHKKEVLKRGLEVNKPDAGDVIDVISKVGGYDIAGMCGAFIGAAAYHMPIVIDGFISIVAALCAKRLCPLCRDYMFPSHESFEIGYMRAARELELEPWLSLGMRLGEGSGCPIAFRIIDAACAQMNGMALFGSEAGIDDGYLDDIRKGDQFTV